MGKTGSAPSPASVASPSRPPGQAALAVEEAGLVTAQVQGAQLGVTAHTPGTRGVVADPGASGHPLRVIHGPLTLGTPLSARHLDSVSSVMTLQLLGNGGGSKVLLVAVFTNNFVERRVIC